MTSWDGLNRRKFPRASYPCLITIRHELGEKESLLTHTENVGIGGVCVILNKSLKLFTPVDLQIDLLDGAEHVMCQGKIVWSIRRKVDEKKKPLFYDMGIEFAGMNEKDKNHLETVLRRLLKTNQTTIPSPI